jgi:hypothetical protein
VISLLTGIAILGLQVAGGAIAHYRRLAMKVDLSRSSGVAMGTLVETVSIEAEIADCCQAIYRATEPEIAMRNWARLRDLTAQKAEAEHRLFLRETRNVK